MQASKSYELVSINFLVLHDKLMPNVYLVVNLTRSKLPLQSMENYTCTFASLCNSGVTEY